MNIFVFFIYSFCAFVPLVGIWAFFMVWSGRWEIDAGEVNVEGDYVLDCESCSHFPTLLTNQVV